MNLPLAVSISTGGTSGSQSVDELLDIIRSPNVDSRLSSNQATELRCYTVFSYKIIKKR